MDSRLIFLPSLIFCYTLTHYSDHDVFLVIHAAPTFTLGDETKPSGSVKHGQCGAQKRFIALRYGRSVPQTDTGRRGENPQVNETTLV